MLLVSRARSVAALIIVIMHLAGAALGSSHVIHAQATPRVEVAPGRYIVLLKPAISATSAGVASAYDARPGVTIDLVYSTAISGFAGAIGADAARDLMNDPRVAGVFPDVISRAAAQGVPVGIDRVDADLNPTVAGDGSGAVDVDIAVIDSGVAQLSDLNLAGGVDCTGVGSYLDNNGHGTHVAGIAAARDNGVGVVGWRRVRESGRSRYSTSSTSGSSPRSSAGWIGWPPIRA